ncbi:MAG: SMC-Scp complex subunit ScpB [Syntrophorhabdaceae bacterium]|nr:SMC-Scp complex subunit ScpB [Syntrophorhabdaceae bacterium]
MEIKNIIEAILFISGRPVTVKRLHKRLERYSVKEIEEALRGLITEYQERGSALEIVEVSKGFLMRTRAEYRDYVKRFVKEKDVELTKAVLETLAIIAYKQPLSKAEVDRLRGVDSSRALKHLLERKLIEVAGRKEDDGRPMVFRTTDRFLEVYGLRSLDDLPTARELELIER